MRRDSSRWCGHLHVNHRKHFSVRTIGTAILGAIFLGSLVLVVGDRVYSEKTSRQVYGNTTWNPKYLRRHSLDDDEIHESELVRAAISSLSAWNHRRQLKQQNLNHSHHRVKRDEEVVCYGELGCFRDEGPFDYLDMLPSSPEEISTRFLLYTRLNRQFPQLYSYFNYTSMYSSHFNSSTPTKIIIHGFGSTCTKIWATEMRLTLLSVVECNVICVDWENGATLPNYVRAAVNTRLVGKQVALFISWLNEHMGSQAEDFHLIGFSLGAHVAGFAGQEVKNLSRITGLDPAGPLYESYDKKVRLDSSDALFVDVIHSNGDSLLMGGLGSWEPMGHVDFYPNGGRVQKGCSNLFLGAVRDFLWSGSDVDGRSLCNHRRAYKFFTESISPRCPFPAFSCESYEKFLAGNCFAWDTTRCGNMGYFADRLPNPTQGLLYLITREDEPFCANQYRLTLESSPSSAPISTYGGIEAVLIGHDYINETFLITKSLKENMLPGSLIQRMIVAHPAIIDPIQIQLKYTAYQGWFHSGITRWSMDSLVLTNAYGKSVSFCARLLLPSGIPVTIRLTPGLCLNRFPPNVGRPIFPLYPYDTQSTATDSSNTLPGATSGDNSTKPTVLSQPDDDLGVMKPPGIAHLPTGNTLGHPSEEMNNPAGPPYQHWTWSPVSAHPPVQSYPFGDNETSISSTSLRPTTDHVKVADEETTTSGRLRICLLNEHSNETAINSTTVRNFSCIYQSEEDAGSGGPVMSNNALGQIASYHQDVLREDELFHHVNTVDVEQSSEANRVPVLPDSRWPTFPRGNQTSGSGKDPPIPPHLSYILQQLDSQGLGPGGSLNKDPRLQGVYGRGILEGSHSKLHSHTRRLVPSSRALKMRPVSLGSVSGIYQPTANGRRQSKLLDMNFSPSTPEILSGQGQQTPWSPGNSLASVTSQSRIPEVRWLHPPLPPRAGNGGGFLIGNNGLPPPAFMVTKAQHGKGFFFLPRRRATLVPPPPLADSGGDTGKANEDYRLLQTPQSQQWNHQMPLF